MLKKQSAVQLLITLKIEGMGCSLNMMMMMLMLMIHTFAAKRS
jgi:hypothetical protein